MKRKKITALFATLAAGILFAGCGESQERPAAEGRPATAESPSAPEGENGTIEITVDDTMAFSLNRFEVAPGQEVRVVLRHTGQMPKEAMGHNFVLLEQGSDVNGFAMAATAARDTDYIPEDLRDQVIAHTELVGGGESDEITFTAPDESGDYDYLCSFPGHALAGMVGVMVVRDE